ncbi:MAG: hypothetical protein U1A62_30570 [Pseudomonas sp.]|nr:hypothetical protein [Pseudomonas sp.]
MLRLTTLPSMFVEVFPCKPVPTSVLADEGDGSEFAFEIVSRFSGKPWSDVVLEDWINIAGMDTIASYMALEAFRYYVPSILLEGAHNPNYLDWALKAILPMSLGGAVNTFHWQAYQAGFNVRQRVLLHDYLLAVQQVAQPLSEEIFLVQRGLETW